MAAFRKLPSGLWQATIRLPSGKRVTKTDKLKSVVKEWATEQEALIARGHKVNPRAGRITVEAWYERWWAARVVEEETRRGDRGVLDNHILPEWREWRMGDVGRLDVQAWVRKMEKDGIGRHAIRRAYNLFAVMMGDAALEEGGPIPVSPCQRITLPATDPKPPSWFTRDDVDRIVAELPDRHGAMTELMCHSALRWGEAAGAAGADRDDETGNPIDWMRGRILVRGVVTQKGKWKPYPKNSASRGEVPVPRWVLDLLARQLEGRPRDAWVFVTGRRSPGKKEPGLLSGANWRVVWYKAIDAANAKIVEANKKLPKDKRRPLIPRYDPHDCRHTAASWLVQAGVPLYEVKALLRHSSIQTTQIYAHLAPDQHDRIEDAWSKIMTHQGRTGVASDHRTP